MKLESSSQASGRGIGQTFYVSPQLTFFQLCLQHRTFDPTLDETPIQSGGGHMSCYWSATLDTLGHDALSFRKQRPSWVEGCWVVQACLRATACWREWSSISCVNSCVDSKYIIWDWSYLPCSNLAKWLAFCLSWVGVDIWGIRDHCDSTGTHADCIRMTFICAM